MSFATVRAQVKLILESVSGIGVVHDYRRHTTYWSDLYARHVQGGMGGQLSNWEITRSAVVQTVSAVENKAGNEPYFHDAHDVVIHGHIAVNDEEESEKQFQDVIDAIVTAFRGNNLLNGTILFPITCAAPEIKHDMFGSVLCHAVEIHFTAIERVGG